MRTINISATNILLTFIKTIVILYDDSHSQRKRSERDYLLLIYYIENDESNKFIICLFISLFIYIYYILVLHLYMYVMIHSLSIVIVT